MIDTETIIRDYSPEDFEEVKRLHAEMGLDYKMPDLGSPLFIVTKVALLNDKIVAIGTVRLEAELYLWIDHKVGEPDQRWGAIQALNQTVMDAAWTKGLDNAVCWVPEEVEKSFQKRLTAMGFSRDRDGWHSYSRPTKI